MSFFSLVYCVLSLSASFLFIPWLTSSFSKAFLALRTFQPNVIHKPKRLRIRRVKERPELMMLRAFFMVFHFGSLKKEDYQSSPSSSSSSFSLFFSLSFSSIFLESSSPSFSFLNSPFPLVACLSMSPRLVKVPM